MHSNNNKKREKINKGDVTELLLGNSILLQGPVYDFQYHFI